MPIDYWFLTRPFRGLFVMQPTMILFSRFKGKKWHHGDTKDDDEKQEILDRNCEYDRALFNNNLKGSVQPLCSEGIESIKKERGSGGRTWASKLFAFGLWYKDHIKHVQLTQAGEALCKAENTLLIIRKQVMNFQYPSPYSKAAHMSTDIKIFPFRFILKLLLDEKIGYLSELELALNVLETKSESEFETIKQKVLTFRGKGDAEKILLRNEARTSNKIGNFEDIANTFVLALYYTQFIDRESNRTSSTLNEGSIIYIPAKNKSTVKKILDGAVSGYYTSLLPYPSIDDETFAKRYGLWERKKDIRPLGRVSPKNLMKKKIEAEIKENLSKRPTLDIDTLCQELSDRLGFREEEIHEIITQDVSKIPNLDEFTLSEFEKEYIKLAVSGIEGSTEFEKRTQEIFKELGYEAFHIAPEPRNPDILVISKDKSHSGIIDSKAYLDYNLPRDHQLRMSAKDGYIEKYREYNYKRTTIALGFFVYVAGGFSGDIKSKIQDIKENTGIDGSCITAINLLKLIRVCSRRRIPMVYLKDIFTLNREILPSDIEILKTSLSITKEQKQEPHIIREQSSIFDF